MTDVPIWQDFPKHNDVMLLEYPYTFQDIQIENAVKEMLKKTEEALTELVTNGVDLNQLETQFLVSDDSPVYFSGESTPHPYIERQYVVAIRFRVKRKKNDN